jgi:hypothetical protein
MGEIVLPPPGGADSAEPSGFFLTCSPRYHGPNQPLHQTLATIEAAILSMKNAIEFPGMMQRFTLLWDFFFLADFQGVQS